MLTLMTFKKMYVIAVIYGKVVCYIHEIVMIKHAEPNQACSFVRYNCVHLRKLGISGNA